MIALDQPNFATTGVGSVPFDDPNEVVDLIRDHFSIPYWPQLSAARPTEDMAIQYTEFLPLIRVDLAKRELRLDEEADRAQALAGFYEKVFAGDPAAFAISPEYGSGLHALLDVADDCPGEFLKGQVVGPFTLAAVIRDHEGRTAVGDLELVEALAQGLAMNAVWQTNAFAAHGKKTIVFFDEAYLSGFGSAFTPIAREDVVRVLSEAFALVRSQADTLIGIHCCGNTDWAMLIETGADIINLDSHGFGQSFLLYPEAVTEFYDRGGVVAWGAVPTLTYTGRETAPELWSILADQLSGLVKLGLPADRIARQALLTPACGTTTLSPEAARHIHQLTPQVAEMARDWA